MFGSSEMLKRSVPIQRKPDAGLTSAIQKYAREIFHELLRIQHSDKDGSELRKRHISAFTFWQYSKLPRLVSDRLFECMSEEKRWACPDLIQWMSLEIRGSLQEQLKIVFKMLDGDKDGRVSRDECVTVLSHAIASPLNLSYEECRSERSRIIQLIDQFFTDQGVTQADFELYKSWYQQGMWELHDAIWDCITETLNSKVKLKNWRKLTQSAKSKSQEQEEQEDYSAYLPRSRSIFEEIKAESEVAIYEGKMYSQTDAGLRSSYYKIVNSELYQFKRKEDQKYRALTYIGHGSCVVPFTPKIETTSSQKLYGLYLISGEKRLKFYIREELNYMNWKRALENVTGSKAGILTHYTIKEDLGEGKFSFVKSAVCKKTGKKVAIKVLNKKEMSGVTSQLVREEINVQRMCKHRNLLQILDVYEDVEKVYLVLELMEGQNLLEYCYKKREEDRKMESQEMMCIVLQLAQALQYLKQFNIVHRDVKAQNVLLSGEQLLFKINGATVSAPEVKLSDFSVSKILTNAVTGEFCGTITHIAPEILEGTKYNYGVDMFSFGVLIYQCITGSLPFFNPNLDKLKEQGMRIMLSQIKYGQPRSLEELKLTLPGLIFQIIYNLLRKRASDRLSIEELLGLPEFEEVLIS